MVSKLAYAESICGAREDASVGCHRTDTQSIQPGRQDSSMELFLADAQLLRQWGEQRRCVDMGRRDTGTTGGIGLGCLGKCDEGSTLFVVGN